MKRASVSKDEVGYFVNFWSLERSNQHVQYPDLESVVSALNEFFGEHEVPKVPPKHRWIDFIFSR